MTDRFIERNGTYYKVFMVEQEEELTYDEVVELHENATKQEVEIVNKINDLEDELVDVRKVIAGFEISFKEKEESELKEESSTSF